MSQVAILSLCMMLAAFVAYLALRSTWQLLAPFFQVLLAQRRLRRIVNGEDQKLRLRVAFQQHLLVQTKNWEKLEQGSRDFLLKSFAFHVVVATKTGWTKKQLEQLVDLICENPALQQEIAQEMLPGESFSLD